MLIGSNLNSDFGPLPGGAWNMEPPRLPLSTGGGSLPQSTNIQLSPTGKYATLSIYTSRTYRIFSYINLLIKILL